MFGDLNYEPDTPDSQSGASTSLEYWVLSHLNTEFGVGHHVTALYQAGVVTHEYGGGAKHNILDYAIIPAARAADVAEQVVTVVPGTANDPFTISDHRPILITIT